MNTPLATEDLSFAYAGGPDVLSSLSFSVPGGRLWAIVGPNGSGKSSLLRLLAGQLVPRSGAVRIQSDPASELPRIEVAKRLAYLPQEFDVAFSFSVLQVVLMGRFPQPGTGWLERPEDRAAATAALEAMDVAALARRPFNALSGGEKQRVMLARTLAQDTPILLLDEPTSSLDYDHQIAVYSLLRERTRAQGLCVITVTHDLNLAAQFADTILFLVGGRGRWCAPPEDVVTRENLQEIYGTPFHVDRLPGSGKPFIVPLCRDGKKEV